MSSHQLYIDDSGTREYSETRVYGRTKGKSRYFVYGGVLMEHRAASLLVTRLRELKALVFDTPDVEVKCNWLRIPDERRTRYLDPFGITENGLTEFTEAYYALIKQAPLELIAVVVDKLHMQEKYGANAHYAPTVAYDTLLQRAVQGIPVGANLSVTVDDISGATPKHNDYKDLLKKHHERLRQRGSAYQANISFNSISGPVRFMNSSHSDLVQVADLAAYNVHRQFRDFGDQWEERGQEHLPTYPYFQKIIGKFRTDQHHRVQGYGIAKVPMLNRVPWRLTREEREG